MSVPFAEKLATWLTYVLPVLGGLLGVAWVNMTPDANPVFGVGGGAVAGWGVAFLATKLLLKGSR